MARPVLPQEFAAYRHEDRLVISTGSATGAYSTLSATDGGRQPTPSFALMDVDGSKVRRAVNSEAQLVPALRAEHHRSLIGGHDWARLVGFRRASWQSRTHTRILALHGHHCSGWAALQATVYVYELVEDQVKVRTA